MRNFNAINKIMQRLQTIRSNKFFSYGLPFMVLLFVGSYGMKHFASIRYEFRKSELFKEENLAKMGVKKKKVSIDEEYEKVKQLDLNAWENVRGPRPWEEPQPQQKNSL